MNCRLPNLARGTERAHVGHTSHSRHDRDDRAADAFMPKLISRLVRRLNQNKGPNRPNVHSPKRRTKPTSLYSERPPPTNWVGARSHSVLQDDANPLTQRSAFRPHKRLCPRVLHSQHVLPRSSAGISNDEPREMTDQERDWWANPYRTRYTANVHIRTLMMVISSANAVFATSQMYHDGS